MTGDDLQDTLDMITEELDARGESDLAAEMAEIVDSITPRMVFKKVFKKSRKNKPKRYLCATKPQKEKNNKGKYIWYSMVKYKMGSNVGWLYRIVGRDPRKRPKDVIMGGKTLRRCTL